MQGINVLSLFDGVSCGKVALDKSGIKVDKYYISEIDDKAIKVSLQNNPGSIHLGDIESWREWDVDWSSIDLIMGGSPCQGFSFSGKQLNFNDDRSALFFVFVDILNHVKMINPEVKFLLENVRMKKEWSDVISSKVGVEPVLINSSLVSAQSRQRLYWANWEFSAPDDRNITLNDILEDGFYCDNRDKSYCIDANYGEGTNFRRYYFCGSRQLVLKEGYRPGVMTKENANEVMKMGGAKWRKLSVKECERLQTIPEGYIDNVDIPLTAKYKALGNGWTIDVLSHIFSELTEFRCVSTSNT